MALVTGGGGLKKCFVLLDAFYNLLLNFPADAGMSFGHGCGSFLYPLYRE